MSKQDQAALLIQDVYALRDASQYTVKTLAKAGLTAPVLPEPNSPNTIVSDYKRWNLGGDTGPSVRAVPGGRVVLQRVEPGDITPEDARRFAHALLAAANHAEEA